MNTKVLVATMAVLTFASCGKKEEKTVVADEAVEVKVTTVTNQTIPQTETYSATVESDIKNNITPNMQLRIEKVLVDVGDVVKKGQCLVQLDASNLEQLRLQINNQKAVLNNQKTDFNRIAELYKVGGVSKAEYDNAKVQLDGVQTQLNVLNSQYAQITRNTNLYAPMSGVVTARNYDSGDMYNGTPILTIEATGKVKVMINVSEVHYKDVKKGQKVSISLDAYDGETFEGVVTIVSPSIDPTTHTFPVEITINNSSQKVRPGMFARATISYGDAEHVVIPDEALVKQIGAGDRYVYVYNQKSQTVTYQKVELGKHLNTNYEILSGVEPGQSIVVAGQARLANGKKVKVVK